MENYIVGSFIKKLREKQNKTQLQLAEELFVSEKTISKWETCRGLPSLSMVENLAKALNVSVVELFNGSQIINNNKCSNLLKNKFYVCPICGNVVASVGELSVSCCGVKLMTEEYEELPNVNNVNIIDGKFNFNYASKMTKNDYISFVAYVTAGTIKIVKLYPEQNCEVEFEKNGHGFIYFYDINNGLFRIKV